MGKKLSKQRRGLVLHELEQSKLSVAEFCRREGLCYATVMRWRRESRSCGSRATKRTPFVEVEITGDGRVMNADRDHRASQSAAKLCAELSLPGGTLLRIYGGENSEARI